MCVYVCVQFSYTLIYKFTYMLGMKLTPMPGKLNYTTKHQLYTSKVGKGSWAPKAHSCPWGPKSSLFSRISPKSQCSTNQQKKVNDGYQH